IDRHRLIFAIPFLRRCIRVGDEGLESWVLERGPGQRDRDGRLYLAVEQHLVDLGSGRRATAEGGIAEFLEVGLIEGEPGHARGIETVILAEDAAHPDARRLRIDARRGDLAFEIPRSEMSERRVVTDAAMMETRADDDRKEDQLLAVGARQQ